VEQEIGERRRSVGSHASPDFFQRKLRKPERVAFIPPKAGFGEGPTAGDDSGEGGEDYQSLCFCVEEGFEGGNASA
jgi:hypothetical protein